MFWSSKRKILILYNLHVPICIVAFQLFTVSHHLVNQTFCRLLWFSRAADSCYHHHVKLSIYRVNKKLRHDKTVCKSLKRWISRYCFSVELADLLTLCGGAETQKRKKDSDSFDVSLVYMPHCGLWIIQQQYKFRGHCLYGRSSWCV